MSAVCLLFSLFFQLFHWQGKSCQWFWLLLENWCSYWRNHTVSVLDIMYEIALIWATSQENLSSEVWNLVRLKLACSATETTAKELFIRVTVRAFRKLLSVYVFSYFSFGFECRIWDLILSVSDHCLSFYLARVLKFQISKYRHYTVEAANNKGADQTARMRRLICALLFT